MADEPVRGQSSPGSPGFLGAVKDAVHAVGNYVSARYRTKTDADNDEAIRQGLERQAEDGVDRLDDHSTSPD